MNYLQLYSIRTVFGGPEKSEQFLTLHFLKINWKDGGNYRCEFMERMIHFT